jgi:hypothetical protein
MPDGIAMNVEWDDEQLRQFVELGTRAVELALKYTATEVWGNIGRKAPVDEGRLAGSFKLEPQDALSWLISSAVHYALYVHNGTGIYGEHNQEIKPRNAKALVFYWKKIGKTVAFKGDLPNKWQKRNFAEWAEGKSITPVFAWVKGMKPRPFADEAIKDAETRADEFVQRAVDEVMGMMGAAGYAT